ncbi:unnamed protein product [Phaeothamnion confervicola]
MVHSFLLAILLAASLIWASKASVQRALQSSQYGGNQSGTCQIWQAFDDYDMLARINNACPCDGRWQSRSAYLTSCIQPVLNNFEASGELVGSKAKLYWFNYLKYMFYLPNRCGACGNQCPSSAAHDGI